MECNVLPLVVVVIRTRPKRKDPRLMNIPSVKYIYHHQKRCANSLTCPFVSHSLDDWSTVRLWQASLLEERSSLETRQSLKMSLTLEVVEPLIAVPVWKTLNHRTAWGTDPPTAEPMNTEPFHEIVKPGKDPIVSLSTNPVSDEHKGEQSVERQIVDLEQWEVDRKREWSVLRRIRRSRLTCTRSNWEQLNQDTLSEEERLAVSELVRQGDEGDNQLIADILGAREVSTGREGNVETAKPRKTEKYFCRVSWSRRRWGNLRNGLVYRRDRSILLYKLLETP